MKAITTLLMIGLCSSAFAVEQRQKNFDTAKPDKKIEPVQSNHNPCAQYGPGFVQVAGTTTCMKIGGSVSVGGGR
jgi:hypothetical protein